MRLELRALCLLAALCVLGASRAQAEKKVCSEEQARQAESETENLKDWQSLHDFYLKYGRCNDGGTSEGVSDAVAKLLANHWNSIAEFVTIAETDKGFEKYVLRHVDATINQERDAPKIRENAQSHCPDNIQKLCKDIYTRAAPPREMGPR